jgi:hypothetical protein
MYRTAISRVRSADYDGEKYFMELVDLKHHPIVWSYCTREEYLIYKTYFTSSYHPTSTMDRWEWTFHTQTNELLNWPVRKSAEHFAMSRNGW